MARSRKEICPEIKEDSGGLQYRAESLSMYITSQSSKPVLKPQHTLSQLRFVDMVLSGAVHSHTPFGMKKELGQINATSDPAWVY